MVPTRKLKIPFLILVLIFVIGTFGYHYTEGWSLLESLYATVITLATVGYGDFHPEQTVGRIFTIILVIFGVGTMAYTIGLVMEAMIEGRLKIVMGRGRLEKKIEKLTGHYIICGCGRIGRVICKEFAAEKVDFVVIDNNPEVIQRIEEEEEYIYYKGDAAEDKTLLGAGIKKARGIVCVLPTGAENLYIILTAKELNPNIYVLSRSEDETSGHRLTNAGADRVISPYNVGGMRMAMAILRPAMLDFIEITTRRESLELQMEELLVCDASPVTGKSLKESEIRQRYGLIVVAVEKPSGQTIFNPAANYIIEKGDKLVTLGEDANLVKFSQVCSPGVMKG